MAYLPKKKSKGIDHTMQELTLREIQLGSLEVLKVIDKICRENNIEYFLFYGTLIGAIRHEGFIPWDDDIDIAMPRDSYERFLDYFRQNIDSLKPFELMHFSTNDKYIYPIARVSDSRYKVEYTGVDDYGLGLFVDIYPFDGWGNTLDEGRKIEKSFYWDRLLISLAACNKYVPSYHNNAIRSAIKLIAYKFAKKMSITALLKKADDKAKKYKYNDCDQVGCTCWIDIADLKMRYKRSLLKPVLHKFEEYEFYIPEGYDEILRGNYGDYMQFPPEEDRVPHHEYKVFRKSE